MTGHAHCHPRIALPKTCDRVVWEPQLNALQISLFEQQGLGMGGWKNTENPADTAKIDTRMNGGAQRGRRTCPACFNSLRPLCLAAHLQSPLSLQFKAVPLIQASSQVRISISDHIFTSFILSCIIEPFLTEIKIVFKDHNIGENLTY